MRIQNNDQLKKIKGGAINLKIVAGIGAVTSFLIGLIDGIINPKKCNN